MVLGCPIRKSADQFICADPRSLSQLITSFVASESLGILHAPFIRLRNLTILSSSLLLLNMSMNSLPDYSGNVENNGFEPLTPCVQGRCSSQLS